MKKFIAKWQGGYCNIPITRMIRTGDVVEIYRDEEFVGMFDLGALELCYVSDREGA